MLKGIPSRIGSDLLKALADMGHGDILIIADDFYPPYTKTPNGVSVQAKGNTAPEMIDAILELLPLDVDYEQYPIQYMVPDPEAAGTLKERPAVWDKVIAVAEKHGLAADRVGSMERTKFYEKAGHAYLTVCTSEHEPYGCFILQKGVL